MHRSIKESGRKRKETVHVCLCLPMCVRGREADAVNASLSEPSLTSLKDYGHNQDNCWEHTRSQMPQSSNDVARRYNLTALCSLRSSLHTGSSQVFICFKARRANVRGNTTRAHLQHTNKHTYKHTRRLSLASPTMLRWFQSHLRMQPAWSTFKWQHQGFCGNVTR